MIENLKEKDFNSNQWLSIRASAGSGKTFSLTSRYIYLLFLGAKPNEILTLTFTQKAQQEMQDRILRTLRTLRGFIINNDNIDIWAKNPYIIELLNLGLTIIDIKRGIEKIYINFSHSNNHIMTFDSFFNMILRKFSFYAGLLNNYDLGKDFNYDSEIFCKTLDNLGEKDFKTLIEFCISNDLKSDNIIQMLKSIKIDSYIHHKVEYIQDWKNQFCKNYNELKNYIMKLIDGQSNVLNLAKRFSLDINPNSPQSDFIKAVLNLSLSEKMFNKLEKLGYDESFYNKRIFEINNQLKNYFDYREFEILSFMMDFYRNYTNTKLDILTNKNKITFSDLNLFCYNLLNHSIDSEFFYFRLDSKINHILIDEFQDTNIMQYMILKPLISEIKSGAGRIENRSLFFVGDEKQAIYSFRGSDSRLFMAISDYLGMKITSLPKNYRSAKNIVEFVNNTFKDKFPNYEIQSANKDIEGYVEVVNIPKNHIFECIKNRINTLLQNNKKDIVILTRKNNTIYDIRDYLLKEMPHLKISVKVEENTNDEFLIILNALQYIKSKNNIYIKNCFKINGESYFRDLDLNLDSTLPPNKIVFSIMETFNLFSKVAISILEKSLDYDDLCEFLNNFSALSIEIDEDKKYDIRIMNIHKSKGLEFDNVILTEYTDESNMGDIFYYNYDKLELKRIFYIKDSKIRTIVDNDFKNIYEKITEEKKKDLINLLYVGFTRPKESLFIIKPTAELSSKISNKLDDKKEESNTPKSIKTFFDNINLETIKIGVDETNEVSSNFLNLENEASPKIIKQESFGTQFEFIRQESKQYNSISRIKGLALHLALETFLKYNDRENIKTILLNKYGLFLSNIQIDEIIDNMDNILNNPIIKSIFEENPEIKCEVSFLNNDKIHRIDCILQTNDKIFILDYKTSDLDLEAKKSQIMEYFKFIKNNFHSKEIIAYLCFANGKILKIE